jgi:uncharacterized membrane protein YeiH
MTTPPITALVLDLVGTFAFALNGALTAVRAARLDIVGVITLGMITAFGGGILRDVLLEALPPATFSDWRYLVVAAGGGLIAFGMSRQLERLATPINVFDALGLSLFAVTGRRRPSGSGRGPARPACSGRSPPSVAARSGTCSCAESPRCCAASSTRSRRCSERRSSSWPPG